MFPNKAIYQSLFFFSHSFYRIDRKMSSSQTNYKLDEAQAIFSELRSIKKVISTGEKERQDLIQVGYTQSIAFIDPVMKELLLKEQFTQNTQKCHSRSFTVSCETQKKMQDFEKCHSGFVSRQYKSIGSNVVWLQHCSQNLLLCNVY